MRLLKVCELAWKSAFTECKLIFILTSLATKIVVSTILVSTKRKESIISMYVKCGAEIIYKYNNIDREYIHSNTIHFPSELKGVIKG